MSSKNFEDRMSSISTCMNETDQSHFTFRNSELF